VLDANKLTNAKEIQSAMRLANQYSNIVVAVSVGNEALVDWNDHMVPADSVIRYVRQVKKSISQPVTVADNYAWWARNGSALAKELDFISVHTYPIWEGKDVDQAMAYTVANLQAVRDALPGSRIVITEAGWATWTGKMNITTFWFEAFDEDWKGEPNDPLGAEKHWGLVTVDRGAKSTLHDLHPALAPMNEAK
jgi:exo-beta-1,3-glucanase (GH17 family)